MFKNTPLLGLLSRLRHSSFANTGEEVVDVEASVFWSQLTLTSNVEQATRLKLAILSMPLFWIFTDPLVKWKEAILLYVFPMHIAPSTWPWRAWPMVPFSVWASSANMSRSTRQDDRVWCLVFISFVANHVTFSIRWNLLTFMTSWMLELIRKL